VCTHECTFQAPDFPCSCSFSTVKNGQKNEKCTETSHKKMYKAAAIKGLRDSGARTHTKQSTQGPAISLKIPVTGR